VGDEVALAEEDFGVDSVWQGGFQLAEGRFDFAGELEGIGAGGFVDITSRAKKIVFSGNFNAGAKIRVEDGKLVIDKEGKITKIVPRVDQVSFSGKRARMQGQDITYVTERCVLRLGAGGLMVTEIAPGLDLQRDVLDQAATPLLVAPDLRKMDARLFQPALMGLAL
jgi:acyl CoA:acetate/3-ketoacid CoA transferase